MASTPLPDLTSDGELAVERAYSVELSELERLELDARAAAFGPEEDDGEDWWGDSTGDDGADQVPVTALGSHPADLLVLAGLDPHAMGRLERVQLLGALDRAEAFIASLRAQALVAVAGPRASSTYLSEVHVEAEVAIARGTSRSAAGLAIETARALATVFPAFAAALRAGEITDAHCRMLVARTRPVRDDDVLAAIEARVLPKARVLPVTAFGREVAKAVAGLDPDAEARHRRARERREVTVTPLDDGMGLLTAVHDWPTIAAIAATLEADAATLRTQRGGAGAVTAGDDDARTGACRADALATRILGTPGVSCDRAPVPVTLEVVIDLETLRGEADHMALLAGQPVPAGVAREWAQAATTWRRCVTDPVTGHLLDYGTRQYLPEPLRRFVLARDGGCRAPTCSVTSPRRLEMDHPVPYPHGPSSAGNAGGACTTDHQLKTAGHLALTDSKPDGSCTWTTRWGQTVHHPPRPFLHDPDPPPF